jgi:translocation protein SEC63
MREWFFTAQSLIEFRRYLVQGLDVKSSELLQIPHFDEEAIKHCTRGKNSVASLSQFLNKDVEQRKGLARMESHQLADIEAFCAHVAPPELKGIVEVEDEGDIVIGDVATVTASLVRKHLREGEAMGPVHAPLFPEPKFEEWWLFLVESGGTATRIIAFERIRDTERVVESKMRFQLARPGKHTLTLHAICDSYAGLDQKVELNFNVLTENEVKREIHIHPEDEDLDLLELRNRKNWEAFEPKDLFEAVEALEEMLALLFLFSGWSADAMAATLRDEKALSPLRNPTQTSWTKTQP